MQYERAILDGIALFWFVCLGDREIMVLIYEVEPI